MTTGRFSFMEQDWIFLFFSFHSSIRRSISLNTRKDTRLEVFSPSSQKQTRFFPKLGINNFSLRLSTCFGWENNETKWNKRKNRLCREVRWNLEIVLRCLSQILKRFRHAVNDGKVNYQTSLLMFDEFNVKQIWAKKKEKNKQFSDERWEFNLVKSKHSKNQSEENLAVVLSRFFWNFNPFDVGWWLT